MMSSRQYSYLRKGMTVALPPSEKCPIVLVRWSRKAQKHPKLIHAICSDFEKHQLVLVPTPAQDICLLTATQGALEWQAERDRLVKKRRIRGPSSSSAVETIMDYFTVENRNDFRYSSTTSSSVGGLGVNGIFSIYERFHLVLGLLDLISVTDTNLLRILLSLEDPESLGVSSNLRYLLQSNGWIDVLTPLHVDKEKVMVQKDTWYPLSRMMPPLEEIDAYYGPQIAYYFAFVGFLGQWLGRLGIVGLSIFLFRIYRHDTLDEDEYTPFYGLICFVWAVLLYRFWERKEFELAYQFGTLELSSNDALSKVVKQDYDVEGGLYSHRRPEFVGVTRTSPVTGEPELYYPPYRRKLQYLASAMVTSFMLGVAFFVMILSLNLQGYIRPKNHYHPFYFGHFAKLSEAGAWLDSNSNWMCYIPVILHALCILTLNALYRRVARKLTDWENHETSRAHDNSLILKRFLFEAFDCYIVLFYLAFYERDVERLRDELVAVFNIDSFRRLAMEVIVPYVLHYRDKNDKDHPHDLHLDDYEQFDDYMEIMIQFGYVTLFASAYPLASLIMAGAVWVEIRCDSYKLTYLCQKPLAIERIHDIGVWKRILQVVVWSSCLTNCMLFGFTSDQMMQFLPDFYIRDGEGVTHMVHDKGWIAILIIFGLERALIVAGLLLQALIPAVPESLAIRLQRRKYLLSYTKETAKKRE